MTVICPPPPSLTTIRDPFLCLLPSYLASVSPDVSAISSAIVDTGAGNTRLRPGVNVFSITLLSLQWLCYPPLLCVLQLPAGQWPPCSDCPLYILFSWQLSLPSPSPGYWALVIVAPGPGNPRWGCLVILQPIRAQCLVTSANERPALGPVWGLCTGGIISLMTLHSPLQVSISPSLIVLTIAHSMSLLSGLTWLSDTNKLTPQYSAQE